MSDALLDDEGAREELAHEMRRITSVSTGRPLSDDTLRDAAAVLRQVADRFESEAPQLKRPRRQPSVAYAPRDFFPTSPVIGRSNPVAPPAEVWTVEGENGVSEIRGKVTFGYQYEGPPTCVHGGVIAELFDEMLGTSTIVSEHPGMTGTLTVRYRNPTPLLTELTFEARCTGTERRKIFAWGGLYHQDVLVAEAEGIFISVQPGQMLNIVTTNAADSSSPVVDAEFIELVAEATKE